ncbi:MAG: aromatic ring-hydroxylating dioxygenase subunit alpha [Pseudomonadota bacterium]
MHRPRYHWPNRELDEAYTLPSLYYYAPAVYEDEKWAIFYKSWRLVAHRSELANPKDYVTCEIFDQHILVVRGDDGVLRAFYNVCQHRGTKLVHERRGSGRKLFVCEYHSWSYSTKGKLIGAPRTERLKNFSKSEICLTSLRVQEFAGFVFINLDPNAKPMEEMYPGADELILKHAPDMHNLQFESEHDFIAPVNWKVVMDNNIESYHLSLSGPAHVELTSMIDFEKYIPRTYDNWWVLHAPHRPGLTSFYGIEVGDQSFQTADYINTTLFPNVTFFCVPYADYVGTFLMIPLEPEKTLVRFTYYVPDREETEITRAGREWMNNQLGPEDVDLNQWVQQGLKSFGFDQGRYFIDPERSCESEHAVHYFHTLVFDALSKNDHEARNKFLRSISVR